MKFSRSDIHRKIHALPIFRFEDQQLTSFCGLVIFQKLFDHLSLKDRLRKCFKHLDVSPIYGHASIVLLLVVHLLLGYRELRHLCYVDLVLSLLDLRITDIRRAALARVRDREAQTLRKLWNMLETARRMAEDSNVSDAEFRHEFLTLIPSNFTGHPSRAAALRNELTSDRLVRTVLSQFLTLHFVGPPDSPILEALSQLSVLRSQRLSELPVVTAVCVPRSWSSLVQSEDRKQALRAFEAATLLAVQKALRNGSIWVSTSFSYRSRDQMFISCEQWQKHRREHYRRLRLPLKAITYIKPRLAALEAGLASVAQAVEQSEISIYYA